MLIIEWKLWLVLLPSFSNSHITEFKNVYFIWIDHPSCCKNSLKFKKFLFLISILNYRKIVLWFFYKTHFSHIFEQNESFKSYPWSFEYLFKIISDGVLLSCRIPLSDRLFREWIDIYEFKCGAWIRTRSWCVSIY